MLDNINMLVLILAIVLVIVVILLAVLCIIYFLSKSKKQSKPVANTSKTQEESAKTKTFAVESVFDFMEFDKIEDNMIIQKDGNKYVMVVECQGVNYDLMSEVEKNSVEEGFIQFLNTLRYPVQIYTQTRTINLEGSIQTYRNKIKEIEENLQKQKTHYETMAKSGKYTKEQLEKAYYELTKQKNLYEYGKDIIYTTERMSLNKNVLNKKYYVIIPYYPEEIGQNDFDKEEIKGMAFSELYTRGQSILGTLSVCGITGRILSSNDLVDLLYVAYNRDEAEVYGLEKALRAGFNELYTTAPDVLDKKMRELDRKIGEEAFKKANEKVSEAKSEKERALEEKEETMDDLIAQMAQLIIEENASIVGEDIAESAVEKIHKERRGRKKKIEGGTKEDVKEEKTKRRRVTKTA